MAFSCLSGGPQRVPHLSVSDIGIVMVLWVVIECKFFHEIKCDDF